MFGDGADRSGFILLKHYVANDMIIFLSICYKPSIYAACKSFGYIMFVPTLGRRWEPLDDDGSITGIGTAYNDMTTGDEASIYAGSGRLITTDNNY